MRQFFQYMNYLDYVTAINAIEYNIFNCNTLLDLLHKYLNKNGVEEWQILSVKKVEGQKLFMVFKSISRTDMTTMIFPITKAATYCCEKLTAPLDTPG